MKTTGPKIPGAGATWRGWAKDTDPRYGTGWNFLTGENLSQRWKKPSGAPRDETPAPPAQPTPAASMQGPTKVPGSNDPGM